MANEVNNKQVTELLYQALETEKGGVEVYTTAVRCAVNEDLKEEWEKYLEQTANHVKGGFRSSYDDGPRSRR